MTASWEAAAACVGHPAGLWFPDLAGPDNHGRHAKTICARCPVARECVTAAVERGEEHGIWGGAGGDQLRWLRRSHGAGGHVWQAALDGHLERLAGRAAAPANRNGPAATCGLRVTYNRGCRCRACRHTTAAA